jgi:hypothetical protein
MQSTPKYTDNIVVIAPTRLAHQGPYLDTVRGTLDLTSVRGGVLLIDIGPQNTGRFPYVIYVSVRRIVGAAHHPRALDHVFNLSYAQGNTVISGNRGDNFYNINGSETAIAAIGDIVSLHSNSDPNSFEIVRIVNIVGATYYTEYALQFNHNIAAFAYNNAISLKPITIIGGSIYEIIFNYPSNNTSADDIAIVRCLAQTYNGDLSL